MRGLVVLVHGLNNSLAVWRPFSEFLNEKGYHVIAPRLAGHEIRALPSSVSVNSWLLNVEHALEQARVRWADKLIYGVGFSLGGAVLDAYASRSPESFEKLVLVAPAIHLTGLANSLRILRTLRLLGLSLPSFTPQKYRSRAWTSLESYNALFNLSDGSIDPASVAPCRQIWLSPRDGLIAYTESRNWAERNACSAADVEVVTPLAVAPAAHPIPVPDMLGETEWRRMTNQILEFFRR